MTEEIVLRPSDRGWNVQLWVDQEHVSGLAVVDQKVRAGSAALKMAGIAGVWTAEQHRKKGYASRVMVAAIAEMERRSYDVSVLFGIPDFYHRYGYVVFSANVVCEVETGSLALPRSKGFRVIPVTGKDLPRIVRIFAESNVHRSGSCVRPRGWVPRHSRPGDGWRMPRMGGDTDRRPGRAFVVRGGRGEVVGYAAFDAQARKITVSEVGGTNRAAYPAMLRRIRQEAEKVRADKVRFCLPADEPFGEYLNRFEATWTINYPTNSGAMARIIGLTSTLDMMCPTLERRLGAAGADLPPQGLTLMTDIGSLSLHTRKGVVVTSGESSRIRVRCSQTTLCQLLFGYRSAEDLAVAGELNIGKRWLPLVSTLFPKGNPYVWWGDRF